MVHRLREALPLSLSSQHIEDLLISGPFYTPVTFRRPRRGLSKRKRKTAPTKRVLIALLHLAPSFTR